MSDVRGIPVNGSIREKLDVYSTGLWIMERLVYGGGDRARGASPCDSVLRIGRSESGLSAWSAPGRLQAVREPFFPDDTARLFDAIRNAVLDYMVSRNIQPK